MKGTRIVNLMKNENEKKKGTHIGSLKKKDKPEQQPENQSSHDNKQDGISTTDVTVTNEIKSDITDVKDMAVTGTSSRPSSTHMSMVTDSERKLFKLRLKKIGQAAKQQSLEEFCQLTKCLLNDLYTSFKKRRVAVQACINEVGAIIATGNAAMLIMEFDASITPLEQHIQTRNDCLIMECKDMKFMKALDVTNTWVKVPDKIKHKIWNYIEQLNNRKDIYLRPEPTDAEIDEIIERSARKVSTFVGQKGRLPNGPDDIVTLGLQVTEEHEKAAKEIHR